MFSMDKMAKSRVGYWKRSLWKALEPDNFPPDKYAAFWAIRLECRRINFWPITKFRGLIIRLRK